MTKIELGKHIIEFMAINPKKNSYPVLNSTNQKAFFVIQQNYKFNKDNILSSKYDDIFYNKTKSLPGKEWLEKIVNAKDISEYHSIIRNEFKYCRQRKFKAIVINDLFYWFNKNTHNSIIDLSEKHFDIDTRKNLEKIRLALEEKDWSIFFFSMQRLMHVHIIKLLNWNKNNLNYGVYSKVLQKKLVNSLCENVALEYMLFVQKVNLYRNCLSKATIESKLDSQSILQDWNKFSTLNKTSTCWKLYFQLNEFITIMNLIS